MKSKTKMSDGPVPGQSLDVAFWVKRLGCGFLFTRKKICNARFLSDAMS